MNASKSSKKIIFLTIIAIFSFLVGIFSIAEIYHDFKKVLNLQGSSALSERIRYYDEVLTMSARLATLREERLWGKRYHENVLPLDKAIQEVKKHLPEVKIFLDKVDKANQELITMERRSFRLVHNGEYKKAQDLLFSKRYFKLKKEYMAQITKALKVFETENKLLLANIERDIGFFSFVLFLSLSLIAICAYYISKSIKQQHLYIQEVLDTQTSLVLITDGKELLNLNKPALNFVGYESYEHFKKEYACLSALFLNEEGYLPRNRDGRNWLELMLQDLNKKHYVKMKNAAAEEKIFEVRTSGYNLMNNNYVVTFTDVTKLKQLQKNLEERVEEKVKALRKQELVLISQAKMASMSEMLENIAHQWRQPLSVIGAAIASVEIKQELKALDDAHLKKSLSTMQGAIAHLSQTIEDFRGFFKQGKAEHFLVKSTLNRAHELLISKFKEQNISFEIICKEDKKLFSNQNELIQVFMNIYSNALDALKESDSTKKVIITHVKQEEKSLSIFIQDSAGGIKEELLEKIFEHRFSTKPEGQGTGIGLYMSRLIVEKSHGSLKVANESFNYNNEELKGACFHISLPA